MLKMRKVRTWILILLLSAFGVGSMSGCFYGHDHDHDHHDDHWHDDHR
jgi:hypothetical protein